MTAVYVIMGVSGSGKSTVGQALAAQLECPFYDGDDFHPPENVAKMAGGSPLTDADRAPWLARLHDLLADHLARGETAVVACSALKESYRDLLHGGHEGVKFVYLQGSFDLIWQRMAQREAHYMKADMLQSQFDTLEEPTAATAQIMAIDQDVADVVAAIVAQSGK